MPAHSWFPSSSDAAATSLPRPSGTILWAKGPQTPVCISLFYFTVCVCVCTVHVSLCLCMHVVYVCMHLCVCLCLCANIHTGMHACEFPLKSTCMHSGTQACVCEMCVCRGKPFLVPGMIQGPGALSGDRRGNSRGPSSLCICLCRDPASLSLILEFSWLLDSSTAASDTLFLGKELGLGQLLDVITMGLPIYMPAIQFSHLSV